MQSKELIHDTLLTLYKLKGKDKIYHKDLERDFGKNWAFIFDELVLRKVVSPPNDEISVNQNYIDPSISYYDSELKTIEETEWASKRSWIAIAISIISIIVAVLLNLLQK